MTTWTLVVVTAGGMTLLITAPWLLARAGRRWGTDDVPIRPPRQIYEGLDESVQKSATARRDRAEAARRASARIVSGGQESQRVIPIGGRRG